MKYLVPLVLAAVFAQSDGKVFEAVSVKPSPPRPGASGGTVRGGPGTTDPGQIRVGYMTLRNVIRRAYGIGDYQLTGPTWMDSERYDIVANVPRGASNEDASLMLQRLLGDRFKLVIHREKKDVAAYSLVVAKGGPKFTEAAPRTADVSEAPTTRRQFDKDGYPILPAVESKVIIDSSMYGGAHSLVAVMQTMPALAASVSQQLVRPVVDATGLPLRYDFKLHWLSEYRPPPESGQQPFTPDGPDLPTALREQLGLRLESKKVRVEVLVVDHLERPAEN